MIVEDGWLCQINYPLDKNKTLRCVEVIEKKVENIKKQGNITLDIVNKNSLMQNPFLKQEYQKGHALSLFKKTFFVTQQEAEDFTSYPQIDLNTDK
jgi:hypothetical protein